MLDEDLRLALAENAAAGLRRTLREIPEGVLDLASNDYLGLARHPEVVAAAVDAAQRFGAGARAARLVSGHSELHRELELALASWRESPSALVFPSGYMANVAVMTALARRGDIIFCDKGNHASIIDGCRLAEQQGARVRYYGDRHKLRSLLENESRSAGTVDKKFRRIIVSDTVYSMDGVHSDCEVLGLLAREFRAVLVLDDAHGLGTLGEQGRGAVDMWKHASPVFAEILPDIDLVQVGTLSKSLGSQGGFVAASETVIEWLVNAARSFVYTTGLNPAACGAALASLRILQREPQRVQRLLEVKNKLAFGISRLGYDARCQTSPVIPVFVGAAERAVTLSNSLLGHGVWCPAIRPPTVPAGTSRLRVTASAGLTDAEVDRALEAFTACRN